MVRWDDDGTGSKPDAGTVETTGLTLALLIYISVMSYGETVMRSVMEEKTGRTVELLLSSVSPFRLMTGKIIGTGLAGMLQLVIWGITLVVTLATAPVPDVMPAHAGGTYILAL